MVNNKNVSKVTLKISKQELVQKPHLMIVPLHSFVKQLPKNSQFQSVPVIEVLYESRKPTVKKVLSCLISNPCSEGERDAFTFLQRFVRGMDMQNLVHFWRFTTCLDIMVGKKVEVGFIKCEGVASRPIAHTCGPLLDIPSTFANYVEFNRNNWKMDIV